MVGVSIGNSSTRRLCAIAEPGRRRGVSTYSGGSDLDEFLDLDLKVALAGFDAVDLVHGIATPVHSKHQVW